MDGVTALVKIIKPLSVRFGELNAYGKVSWEKECSFAVQQLSRSPKLMSAAINDPLGVKYSVLNVAATGISLNPVLQHAYLIPRDGKICLDISFRGLIYIATDSGSIKWAKSDLVYSKDVFEWNGMCEKPTHKAEVFGERGEVLGGYCLAMLSDGSFIADAMRLSEIKKVQSKSKAQYADSPWNIWWEEMAKKCIIKRAAKTWPQMANEGRLETAIHVLNEHEGIVQNEEKSVPAKSGVEALEELMPNKEPKEPKSNSNDIPDSCLILDEIECAGDEGALKECAEKISSNESLSKDDKDKLRMAYQEKQKELKDGGHG